MFFIQGMDEFHTLGFIPATTFTIFLCICYFRQIILSQVIENPLRDPIFWIATGVLFFYVVAFFPLGLFHHIENEGAGINKVFNILLKLLNVILYGMYIVALTVRPKP